MEKLQQLQKRLQVVQPKIYDKKMENSDLKHLNLKMKARNDFIIGQIEHHYYRTELGTAAGISKIKKILEELVGEINCGEFGTD